MTLTDRILADVLRATSIDERKRLISMWARAVVRTMAERGIKTRYLMGPRRLDDVVAANRTTGDYVLRFAGWWRKRPTTELLTAEKVLAALSGRA